MGNRDIRQVWIELLVAEDDLDVQEISKTILTKEGHEVNVAGTGREAFILDSLGR